ncbi:MAG: hypothetical protein IH622_03705 [Ochrobactrum anthropi]|uniref:Uncharacterized protein n=1 Tax=Brucella anthropi TaxID=529 RepID=A0A8I0N2Q7_BRUAN|nr:hypothetical protein [Brucella anthropi]MBE0559925.1 hypothetical protein [Brucella anthropi]
MADDKEKTQRRVYVLPTDLVERIVAYQQDMGLPSEVEAARRLLDEALMRRDDWRAITNRFLEKLKETRVMSDIAKDILVGHPLVSQVRMDPGTIKFDLTSGETIEITNNGLVTATDNYGQNLDLNASPFSRHLDDEIPF